jgi:hypothetical protein
MKILQFVAELFHVEGQTDIKLRVAFSSSAKSPIIKPYYLQGGKDIESKFYGITKRRCMNQLIGNIPHF